MSRLYRNVSSVTLKTVTELTFFHDVITISDKIVKLRSGTQGTFYNIALVFFNKDIEIKYFDFGA